MTVAIRPGHPIKDRLLIPAQRTFWEENGYVIIPDAVPQENLAPSPHKPRRELRSQFDRIRCLHKIDSILAG